MFTFIGLLALILVIAPQAVRLLGWALQALALALAALCHAAAWLLDVFAALHRP